MPNYESLNRSSGADTSDPAFDAHENGRYSPISSNHPSETEGDGQYERWDEEVQHHQHNLEQGNMVRSQSADNAYHRNLQPSLQQTEKNNLWNRLLCWKWEIAACWLFLVAIFAILATLYPHQGRPQPNWPYDISINALLSVYSAVFQACLAYVVSSGVGQLQWRWYGQERPLFDLVRYDAAGRGPLGSLRWLGTNHLRQPLTTLGAIITIITIAIDPFIQQLVAYDGCSVPQNGTAVLPRTNYFIDLGTHLAVFENAVPPQLEAAVNTGVFSGAQPVSFNCSTGNYTFAETFATVGYCSKCQDISDSIQFAVIPNGNTSNQESSAPPTLITSIPGGISVTTNLSNEGIFDVAAMGIAEGGEIQFLVANTSILGLADTLGGINKTTLGCNDPELKDTWTCRSWGAASCTLGSCVRVYRSSITAGALTETVLEDSSGIQWGIDQLPTTDFGSTASLVDTQCVSPEEMDGLINEGYKIDPSVRWLSYNTTTDPSLKMPPDSTFPESLQAHNCLYSIDASTDSNLFASYIWGFLTGNITCQLGSAGYCMVLTGPQDLLSIYNFSSVNFEDVQKTIGNTADSLTNFVRENGNPNRSIPANGTVLHYETCVNVRWGWISLPAALAALTLLFFPLTVVTTERYRLPIWKSNPLALVFHGPQNTGSPFESKTWTNQAALSALQTTNEMELASKEMKVKLDNTGGVPHLAETAEQIELM